MNQFNPHPDDDLLALLLADDQEQTQGLRAGAAHGANQGPAAVSFAQQRLWLLQQFNPDSAAYNLPRALSISGELDADLLQQALQQVVERHDILRTFFSEIDGTPRQTVDTGARLLLTRMALGNRDELDACLQAEAARPFDLGVAPLIRATLLRIGAQEHVLLLTLHHIVSDAWSNPILIHDLAQAFARLRAGDRTALPRPGMQYSDYARWQREDYVSSSAHERAAVYWKNYLGNELPTLALPTDFAPSAVSHNSLGTLTLDLPERLTLPLKALCQRLNVTPFMVLLGAWQLLLARYSGQQDFTVGVPNASRNQSATQELVGFFVSSQIYRARLKAEHSVEQFLQDLRQASLAALEHADYPVELLLEQMNLQRSTQANPLFQTLFNWRVAEAAPAALRLGDLQIQSLPTTVPEARFDLSIDVEHSPETIRAELEYRSELFLPQTIARLGQHWQQLLQAMLDNPAQAIGDLPMLSAQERQQLHDWNATQIDYPLQQPIYRLIEQQVARTPEAIALMFAGQQLSYAQLNQRANQLAHHLIALGVGPEVVVGIALERSVEMVIGLLAILKAGGAYLPLDPDYPAERLAYMIEDSGIALLLTHSDTQQHLPAPASPHGSGVSQLNLDTLDLTAHQTHNPTVQISAENLAYVIYTSGSTGRPKGAGNRHGALTNRICWMQQAYALDHDDTVLQKTPFSFDVSVWEFFWPLLTGARLALALPGDHRDPARLIELIQRLQITTLHFVPSMLQAFLQDDRVTQCSGLKRIICSGEALPLAAQQQIFAKLPTAALYNLYGPTEAAIDVTHWTCRDDGGDSVPIGQPIANLGTWILDAQLQPVPVGVAGELYLGGVGLARGYHRRPALTAERFVTSPFGKGERLYRTGDLARYRADGVIQYLGRIDHQVKIRGLRIELGEIEACLLALPEISEAAVVAHHQQLIGYVVPAQLLAPAAQDALQAAISVSLGEKLPDYMVPTRWVFLAHMPLSANGKLDRKALPLPDTAQHADAWVAAQSPLQQRLVRLWQDVLKRERLGIRDNYFDLGGDSIISIQLVSRARQAGIHFTPKQLFEQQTIERLAQVASASVETCALTHPAGQGDAALLPIQQAFFERDFSQRQHWNQSVVLRPVNNLDADTLEQALRALLAHHDGLRLTFAQTPQGWIASYQASSQSPFSLWQSTLADISELQQLGDEAQRSLDLHHGPLLRAVLVNLADGSQRLLLVIHHLVVDGVSWRILFEDLQCAYGQLQAGQAIQLPARTSSLQAFSQRLQAYAHGPQMLGELSFWQTHLRDIPATLPDARADASLNSALARNAQTRLDQDLTRRLLQDAPGAYRTQINDLLLSALSRVISRWTGQPRIAIQLEGHGREVLFDDIDLSRSVGWFTSLYPVSLTPDADMAQTIKTVKEQLRALPGKGIGFGALRYLGDDASREALRQLPTPRITFNYLGQFDSSFADKHPTVPDALFTPCADNAGAEQSLDAPLGNWLTLNGRVYGGELSIGWTYSHEMFDDALMQKLADEYASELRLLVEHCARHQGVTPADFPLAHIDQQRLDAMPVTPRLIQDLYPLAPMQQGMLFHTLHEQAVGNYLNQMRLDVSGLDPERFREAWQAVLDHHDILRSSFHWKGDLEQPLQMVHAQVQMPFTLVDGQGESQQNLDALATGQREQGFDLSSAPLLNLIAVQTGAARHHLILTHHHILMDGWSLSQLLGEVLQRYRGQPVEPAQARYRDYIQWLQQQDQGASEAFWREQFQAFDAPTLLARSLSSGSASAGGNDDYSVALTVQQSEALNAFAREQKVTLNTLLQAAWALLLQRYTGQQRVCFGATVAGRPAQIRGIEQQIGLFINTLPVVSAVLPEVTVSQWLQALQTQNLSLREHEHSALADVQRWAGHGGEALFDTLLVFENYPIADALQQGSPEGLHFSNIRSHEQTNYPLTLIVNVGAELSLRLNHDRGLFSSTTIATLARQLLQLLTALPAYAQRALGELPVADQADSLLQWNPARRTFPSADTLAQRIETQAAHLPDAVALSFDGEQLTYAELNQRANRLAHLLIERGVGPDRRVGLAAERSAEMIIGLLAILKAGGAYVPLDPAYPQERLRFMIDDSGIDLLLAQASVLDQLPLTQRVDVLLLNHDTRAFSDSNPQVNIDPANLAYVIYTSGSTGQPKGALLTHDNVLRLFAASAEHFQFGADDVWTLFHSYAFDFSVWEIFGALLHGGRLVIVPHAVSRSPEDFHALLVEQGVTVLNQTPSAFKPLMAVACASAQKLALRYVIFGGEALDVASLKPWFDRFDEQAPQMINMYGITETTVHVTYRQIRRQDLNHPQSSPIGIPLADLSWYLLDSALNPVPKGCIGELYIGGAGLARGYLNRQDLTATRFVPNLFADDGSLLYRTGDLARYGEDGSIDYLGRSDQQVKVRGFRIELGEIEAQLLAQPQIRQAVVLARDTGSGQQLVAYLVADEAADLEPIRDALKQKLPDYMVPTHLIFIDQLPLTGNGKLDRKALPEPDASLLQSGYVAPQSQLEQQIASIWQDVLKLERVGLGDNFFELGGHSLLVIKVVSRLQLELGLQLTPQQLFQAPTLGAFAASLASTDAPFDSAKLSRLDALLDDMEDI